MKTKVPEHDAMDLNQRKAKPWFGCQFHVRKLITKVSFPTWMRWRERY